MKNTQDCSKKRNIWIDCDPGIDDAVAIGATAASADRLNLLGISTVAGNQTLENVTENAKKLADLFLLPNIPIARGTTPLIRTLETASIHGDTGLGECVLPASQRVLASENAVRAMYHCFSKLPEGETVTLVPIGPLTNIALLLRVFPEVKRKIDGICMMGGAWEGGNCTPYSEFNIWIDPEAAAIVFNAGIPIVMCGLDITMKCGLTHEQIDQLVNWSGNGGRRCGEMLEFYAGSPFYQNRDMVAIHDAVAILYLLEPQLFHGEKAQVCVSCTNDEHQGQTVCQKNTNGSVLVLDGVDLPAFQSILMDKLKSLD